MAVFQGPRKRAEYESDGSLVADVHRAGPRLREGRLYAAVAR